MFRKLTALLFFSACFSFSAAEPIVLTQAGNVLPKGRLEAGVDISYAYDKYTLAAFPGIEYTSYYRQAALSLKYAFDNSFEAALLAPYTLWTLQGTGLIDSSAGGIGQMTASLKYSAGAGGGAFLGLLFTADIPSGDSKQNLGTGLNLGLTALLKCPLAPFVLDVNAGYELTYEYVNPVASKVNPGDNISFGAALELPSGAFTWLFEANAVTFGNYSVDGADKSGTAGLTLDLVPGIRYTAGNFKAKLGFAYAAGDPTYTTYQWKILSGLALVL